MIPEFNEKGYLPAGIHVATWAEVVGRFGFSTKRKRLLEGLARGLVNLKQAGCKKVFLDGSFVTDKEEPGDFDLCWDPVGVKGTLLDPVILLDQPKRENQKKIYFGEFFIDTWLATPSEKYVDFFQNIKHSTEKKGIIQLNL